MAVEIREVGVAELGEFRRAEAVGFHHEPSATEADIEHLAALLTRPGELLGAFDGGRCVATYHSFPHEVTAPGGAFVPSNAVSRVTVTPTHRRRGLLTRMITEDLRVARERGEILASLIAAEYPIYGRFGFGPAAWLADYRVDLPRAGATSRWSVPEEGTLAHVDPERVMAEGPALHDRMRALRHGVVTRPLPWWRRLAGLYRPSDERWTTPVHLLYTADDGTVEGLATYRSNGKWEGSRPAATLTVQDLIATTPAAERALWRHLCSIDWAVAVETGGRAPDDTLPHWLGDPRAAVVRTYYDSLWLRPLDVPRLLESRAYPAEADLVLDVHDPQGLTPGRFLLQATPDGASCTPTTRTADLTLDVGALATLWIGDDSAHRLSATARLTPHTPDALTRADLLFPTPRRPWCPDIF
ncbi:GNAT family N-acetyltransferase [Actinocorallia sp. API 0066]|uniref:GNAT family N-acetyltransferase n=1 Tax=Actinocorallia sp. API 0066 TaxID=2896846 RepID=UPI001E472EA7|nr:GNAT family N-acetyltransferase [Actinocorallia sp. API 0066]MCD0449999.1 GNAT family N-acetyltransferase [Actinocorallia sp. API 0066]